MGILSKLFGKKDDGSDRGKERLGWSEDIDYQEEFLKDEPKEQVKKKANIAPVKEGKKDEFVDIEFDSDFFLGNTQPTPKKSAPAPAEKPAVAKKENTPRKVKTEAVAPTEEVKKPGEAKSKKTSPKPNKTEVNEKVAEPESKTTAKKNVSEDKKTENKTKKAASADNKAEKAPTKAKKSPATNAEVSKVQVEKELEDDSPEVKEAIAVQESRATANGKFDIRRAKDGRYFFSLYASNHAVIAYSQIYASTKSVNTGINSVISNASKAPIEDTTLKNPTSIPCPKWEIYIDKAGQYRFRLYAANGLCVCHSSHGYSTKSGCKGGIDSIGRFAAEARVDKSYLAK